MSELYLDPSVSPQRRSEDLLRKMSVEEKIGQLCKGRGFEYYSRSGNTIVLNQDFVEWMRRRLFGTIYGVLRADWWTRRGFENGIPAGMAREARNHFQKLALENSRWKIPFLFVEEAPHGIMALDTTVFPASLGMGATFDFPLLEEIGSVMGRESAAAGIHSLYAPILDLAVDPRWSRVEECFSENPFLVSELAGAMVKGIRSFNVEPTLKHFVGGGRSEGGHNQESVQEGFLLLNNQDLRPFRTCIRENPAFVMCTYHDVDGEPCTGSSLLLNRMLRGKLHFKGFVAADAGAIEMLHYRRLAKDKPHAAARALLAGCDGDSGHSTLEECGKYLMEAWESGLIRESDLDRAAGRLLEIKFALGLFEHPYTDGKPETVFASAPHREVALRTGRESLVLLKNDGILPLSRSIRSLAVIGPNADQGMNMLGDYTAPQRKENLCTVLEGIRHLAEEYGIQVFHAPGCGIRKMDRSGFSEALNIAGKADLIVWVPGGCSTRFGNVQTDPVTGAALTPSVTESDTSEKESGEGTDRATLDFSGVQMELFRLLTGTGKKIITVPIMGRPLLLGEMLEQSAALLCGWYPGMLGGQAIAEALFGCFSPAGRLPISLPRSVGQLPVHGNAVNRTRRNYLDSPGSALLPFGFGLSYTTFEYRNLNVDGRTVSILCRNTGGMASDEVVLFYLQAEESSVIRPERELFAFRRIHLAPGEEQQIKAELTDELLGLYDRNGDFRLEPGKFRIFAGGNPDELPSVTFELTEQETSGRDAILP